MKPPQLGRARRRVIALALTAALAVGLAACSSDTKVKRTDDGKITVKGSGKKAEVTIQGDGSDLTFNQQKVPVGFPADVPLPKGLARIAATSGTAQGKPLFQLTYQLGTGSATTALASYQRELESAAFTIERPAGSDQQGSNSVIFMTASGHGWQISGASVPGPKPETVVISITK